MTERKIDFDFDRTQYRGLTGDHMTRSLDRMPTRQGRLDQFLTRWTWLDVTQFSAGVRTLRSKPHAVGITLHRNVLPIVRVATLGTDMPTFQTKPARFPTSSIGRQEGKVLRGFDWNNSTVVRAPCWQEAADALLILKLADAVHKKTCLRGSASRDGFD